MARCPYCREDLSRRMTDERQDAEDDFFMRIAALASEIDIAQNGPNQPGSLRSLHAIAVPMGEILRLKRDYTPEEAS